MNTKIFIYLRGGIGNQMFQYAMARSLSIENKLDLHIDKKTGFKNDKLYSRKFELDNFSINYKNINFFDKISFFILRFFLKFKIIKNNFSFFYPYNLIVEKKLSFNKEIKNFKFKKNTWIIGYWQSPLYFNKHKNILLKELMPPKPNKEIFIKLGNEIQKNDSLALGIRLYEESASPLVHIRNERILDFEKINLLIKKIIKVRPNLKIYLFCSHRSKLLKKLNLPNNTKFITEDDGYVGALDNLWLLSRCRHHISTNSSSFYWWGCYLSQKIRGKEKQLIYWTDNFVNRDWLDNGWNKF